MNVGDLIRRAATQYPDHVAIRCGATRFTAAEVYQRANRLANALAATGCEPGTRVGVYLPNCVEYMEVDFGLALAGLVRVSLNVRLPSKDILRILRDAQVSVLIFAARFETSVAEQLPNLPPMKLLLRKSEGGSERLFEAQDYEGTLSTAKSLPVQVNVGQEDLYCLFYTSGTTGKPKGVMLSHRAQMAVAFSLLIEFPVRSGEKVLLPQPLSHGAGFFMLPYFINGAQCVVMEKFDPGGAIRTAAALEIETIKLVPAMLHQILQVDHVSLRLPSLRRMIYGAAPIPLSWLHEALQVFGPVLAQLYGQAEAPMCITVLPEDEHVGAHAPRILASAGRPWRNVEVRIVDGAGVEVKPGDTGEVIVKGDHLMDGYWRKPGETRAVLRKGYLHTRDAATIDERGFIYLMGRTDDLINSGGFKIAPRTVEDILHGHPAILEAAVIGVPHPTFGHAVKAFIVLRQGEQVTPESVIDYCRPLLGMQRPQSVEILPELPKNAYGKTLKVQLRSRVSGV